MNQSCYKPFVLFLGIAVLGLSFQGCIKPWTFTNSVGQGSDLVGDKYIPKPDPKPAGPPPSTISAYEPPKTYIGAADPQVKKEKDNPGGFSGGRRIRPKRTTPTVPRTSAPAPRPSNY